MHSVTSVAVETEIRRSRSFPLFSLKTIFQFWSSRAINARSSAIKRDQARSSAIKRDQARSIAIYRDGE
jgi:hypothetical protein